MASRAPGKPAAKPAAKPAPGRAKPGAAKGRPVIKQKSPEEKLQDEYKEAFSVWDTDKDGRVSTKELGGMMRAMGATPSDEEARNIARLVDKDGTGTFSFKDFQDIMAKHSKTSLQEAPLVESFKVFDPTNSGFVATQELRRMMTILGERLSKEEINAMIDEAEGPPGKVDYKKYVKILLTRN